MDCVDHKFNKNKNYTLNAMHLRYAGQSARSIAKLPANACHAQGRDALANTF